MSCERLPQELIDGIFHYLGEDKQALKVSSLVCKAWLYPAYRQLFYYTRLSWYRLAIAYDPRTKSTAAPFIRRLRIRSDSRPEWNETFPSLDGFHSVTSLSLENLPWDEIFPEIRLTISNRFITIVRLELQEVVTTAFSELAQIICTFRSLESLILGSTVWNTSNEASSLLRLPPHLHALELDGAGFTEILEWLCSFGPDLTLRSVCFWNPLERHYHVINKFLRDLGPSLESFRIRLELVGALLPVLALNYGQHHFVQSIFLYVCSTIRTSVSFTSMSGAESKATLGLLHCCRGSFQCTWKRFPSPLFIFRIAVTISSVTASPWNGLTWMPY
jgi:hypothetical protein